jgi:hypothetical protein
MTLIPKHPSLTRIFLDVYLHNIFYVLILLLSFFLGFNTTASAAINKNGLEKSQRTAINCPENSQLNEQISHFIKVIPSLSIWSSKPEEKLQTVIEKLELYLFPGMNISLWENMRKSEKLTEIPLIMYPHFPSPKEMFWDMVSTELAEDFQSIKNQEIIPISFNQLISDLQTNLPPQLKKAIASNWITIKLPIWLIGFNFTSPVKKVDTTIDKIDLILISGGQPITIHADSRYQLLEILTKSKTRAIAAVDGTFFSLKYLTSNVIIGPVLSQSTKQFQPGNNSDDKKIAGRPLALISPYEVRFIPFDPEKYNTLEGIQAEMPDVTDAFVAGAWLVRDGQPQTAKTFKGLSGFDAVRYRAFWGINQDKQPTVGISRRSVDAVSLGAALAKAGLQDAVMLDSGQSTSLAFQGQSLTNYTPRPVPHAIALIPPITQNIRDCLVSSPEK